MANHSERSRILANPYERVCRIQSLVSNIVLAHEQQTMISLLKLSQLLKRILLINARVCKSDVVTLFGNFALWHDAELDKRRSVLLRDHEISFSTAQIEQMCTTICVGDRSAESNNRRHVDYLGKMVRKHLGWQKIE